MQAMAGMAAPAFTERRAQNSMLRYKFPKLAALPLDRGGPDMRPLTPQPMWRFKQYLVAASHVAPGAGPTRNRNITSFRYNGARWHAIQAWPKAIAQNGNLFNPDVREDGCRV